MDDTAQPLAAETDPFAQAAEAFKTFDPAAEEAPETPERPRDEKGRFASQQEEAEEIEAEEGEPEAAASDEEQDEGEDAAEEAQQSAVEMPSSWSKEDAEIWSALPPDVQGKIAEREGQRDAAVNHKFQEAANLRKAHEAEISEAQANRQRYAEALDFVISTVQPQQPSPTMLDPNSNDYDPDAYHLRKANFDQQIAWLQSLAGQRQTIAAQEQAEAERATKEKAEELNRATGPAFIKDFPDAADPQKAQTFFGGLVDYALKAGAPQEFFQNGPMTAIEWHLIAKARAFDELQAAKARVKQEPKPEPRKATPAVRPGVATTASAAKAATAQKARDRLAREGSVEAGAAVWKQFL